MPPMLPVRVAPYVISVLIVIVAAHWGVSRAYGAHPFWSTSIAWIGAPTGVVFALLIRRRSWPVRLCIVSSLLALSAATAHQGRLAFAASFAENRLAGQAWYLGWIGVAVASSALIAVILTPLRR
ncbi:hypothetical protein EF888_18005 [Silicimonas algicola]|uniref:Transmembrane protein n=1 Tax=Silicimonas algicola TaxID=1826607 RepID=A0A316G7W5_9RHOB|nr:hypothetical protein [Silicimonas algicola]AZQ68857.1 hypothetical protein EF888_18005 [Silicimonas algicola]PWK56056.1 hypothetical protein C8D95_105121 [Silicimonas algicola]